MHNEVVAARIPEMCAFNNIAWPLNSGLRSNVQLRPRCAYHPKGIKHNGVVTLDANYTPILVRAPMFLDAQMVAELVRPRQTLT